MEYKIHGLFLEATRRCNLSCEHCMRGEAQNLDLTRELVDEIFDKLRGVSIERLVFTGGEPTLNPDIIVYTINKIINERIHVDFIQMVTNGQVFDKDVAEAFERYNLYSLRERIVTDYDAIADINYKLRHAVIAFSRDEYHDSMDKRIKELYRKHAPHTLLKNHVVSRKMILKTGRATFGKEFTYKLRGLPYQVDPEEREVSTNIDLYLSAKGLINNSPDGSYEDMDNINFGSIHDFSLQRLLCDYGYPIGGTPNLNDFIGKPRMMIQHDNQQ